MSLKSFHIFFILIAVAITAGFGWWGLREYSYFRNMLMLVLGALSFAGAVGLVVYLVWFLKKAKDLPS